MRQGKPPMEDLSCFDFCLSASGPAGLITFCLRSEPAVPWGLWESLSFESQRLCTWTKEELPPAHSLMEEDEQSVGAQSLRKQSDFPFLLIFREKNPFFEKWEIKRKKSHYIQRVNPSQVSDFSTPPASLSSLAAGSAGGAESWHVSGRS